ncbi:MAG: penicillin acylase family protein [Acidobacteria bacterium]|nr:penicillin acylase family protein [Acidobacteriota bacterium]
MHAARRPTAWLSAPALLLALLATPVFGATRLEGLHQGARIVRTADGVPHVYAAEDLDAAYLLGRLHAQDRFFQMDSLRRIFSGTTAEIVGDAGLASDVQFRTLGLRRAAEETRAALGPSTLSWLEAYADGANEYLASHPLPLEYTALELTSASVPKWTVTDSLVIAKGLAFGLSFELTELDTTPALLTYQASGTLTGFDGTALFFEDLFRVDPLDPTVSIPGFLGGPAVPGGGTSQASDPLRSAQTAAVEALDAYLRPEALELARSYRDKLAAIPNLRPVVEAREAARGSNWWMVGPELSADGRALLANDPHLSLGTPATFYEAHLQVFDPNRRRVLSASGITFPGVPAIAQGCNSVFCWGSTTNPLDVTDVYQEVLVFDPQTGLPKATIFDGQEEPVVLIPQVFRVNQIGDGIADDLSIADVGPLDGGLTLVVPRRNNGPIVAVMPGSGLEATALSVQYTGWRATFEVDAFLTWLRATSLDGFVEGLQHFDVGSQNWAYVDVFGNFAYFTSAEMPLREDLQTLNAPDGAPPFLIRDGTHTFHNEWLEATGDRDPNQALNYQILPFSEMPQVVNPERGYILSANNDPVGTTLDNNPLNQVRPGGGLYYLNAGYANLRAGRIQRLIDEQIASGEGFTLADLERMQANNQLLDAELLAPFIVEAFANAGAAGAPAALASLAADPGVAEAVGRIAAWDFSTPTGIPEGYDPGDGLGPLPEPGPAEVAHSVAATLYATWRGQLIHNVIDETLDPLGMADVLPDGRQALMDVGHLLLEFDQNQGVGVSGLAFFPVTDDAPTPEAARDLAVLESLRDALDLLSGPDFEAAFGGSTDQEDYRWGRLHRIVFDHLLGTPFSVPPAGGFPDLSAELPGIPRAGGFQTVDAASHSTRADAANDFMFGSGPARRFVGAPSRTALEAYQTIPGGASGILGSPFQTDQLRLWLVNEYHPLVLRPSEVQAGRIEQEVFAPGP